MTSDRLLYVSRGPVRAFGTKIQAFALSCDPPSRFASLLNEFTFLLIWLFWAAVWPDLLPVVCHVWCLGLRRGSAGWKDFTLFAAVHGWM